MEPRFNDDDAARTHLESLRWPNGAVCPHCGGADRQSKLEGKAHRPGVYFCGHCRSQYTVTVGSVFERSKVALHFRYWKAPGLQSQKVQRTDEKADERLPFDKTVVGQCSIESFISG